MQVDDLTGDDNPATRLWLLLTEWRVSAPGAMIYEQRGGPGEFWQQSVEAVRLCELVEDQVEAQSATDDRIAGEMAPILTACKAAIFSVDHVMSASTNSVREQISEASLLALRFFARSWRPVTLQADAAAEVLDLVRRLRELVLQTDSIDPRAKDYISRLTSNIEATLTASRIWGTVDLEDQSLQLAAAVQAFVVGGQDVDEKTKAEGKSHLVRLQNRLTTMFWVDVAPMIVGAGWNYAQRAIGAGPNG